MYVKELDEDHAHCVIRFKGKYTGDSKVSLLYSVSSMPDDPNRFDFNETEFLTQYKVDNKFITKAFRLLKQKSMTLS